MDRDRGYGFLDYDGGQSVFLHVSEVLDGDFKGVNVGAKFEFHLGFGEKGMLASKAKIIAER